MNSAKSWAWNAGLPILVLLLTGSLYAATQCESDAAELDRQRLIGVAHYENDDYEAAAAAFRRCVELAPDSADDQFNLALCLMRDGDYDQALSILDKVETLDPELVAVQYVRGMVQKNQGRYREAIQSLKHVTERDPQCFGAYYNLGFCYKKLEDTSSAKEAFEAAIRLDPEHPSAHYQMITVAREMGDVEEAKRHIENFERIKHTIDESEKTAEALEASSHSELIRSPRLGTDLEPAPEAAVRFVDVTERSGLAATRMSPPAAQTRFRRADYDDEELRSRWLPSVGGGLALGDVDRDGDLDIFVVGCASARDASANRLYVNEGEGRFADVTNAFGLGDSHRGMDAVFGDYDNDGHDDLYVVNDGPNILYRKQGDGAYEVTAADDGMKSLAIVTPRQPLPDAFTIEVEFESRDVAARDWNAFVIVDYRNPEDFTFAGARVADGYWTLGHNDGTWVDDARLEDGITIGEVHRLHLRIDGGHVILSPGGTDSGKQLSYDFGRPLNRGGIGLAVDDASTRFDSLRIGTDREATPERPSGDRDHVGGTWRVVDWTFEDVSEQAQVNEPQLGRQAVFFDYDHDNDLDIFVVNGADLAEPPDRDEFVVPDDFPGQVNTLLRNSGNGIFDDLTDEAGLLIDLSRTADVVFGDWDGDSDTDLFVANVDADSLLLANRRLGRFAVGGNLAPPIRAGARAAATSDFNRDGHMDLLVAVGQEVRLYTNAGSADFEGKPLALPERLSRTGVGRIEVLDYNNDGWSDLLLVAADGKAMHLLAGSGKAEFRDVTNHVGLNEDFGWIADVAVGDLDGDGDEDAVLQTRDAGLRLLMNHGGNQRHWLDVRVVGKRVNRSGYGAYVEIAVGGHHQKQLVHDGAVHFGLGDLAGVDIVRVTWPNGVNQNVIAPATNTELSVDEHVKVSASCGFLWAHNGTGFELINEVLGVGALGAPIAPGEYHPPDSTELIKIEAAELVPRNGSYELRLTEELREIMYVDQISLRVVDHPAGLEIVPNEMFTSPPFPADTFYAVGDARPPRSAIDDRRRDVLDLVARRDGRFPTFGLVPHYEGLAEPHALTLDLGELAGAERVMLYLDGWIYWPEASTVMALAQDPRHELQPLALQMRDKVGRWRTVIESVGLPTSKGMIVPVDLTGRVSAGEAHVRLTTNMRIYFDRIFVSTRDEAERCRVTELPVARADLDYRGFSAPRRDRLGYERFDYDEVRPTGSWSPPKGMFTRYGDVTSLLAAVDDMYVIFGPGDELGLHFESRALPRLPDGWKRDFIFYSNGWVKDGDLNTKFSETVEPLPFHGMSGYPYPETEQYPDTIELRRYREEYNTRPAVPTVGRLPLAGGRHVSACR
jgi:Flp pilus assembly protein TadD